MKIIKWFVGEIKHYGVVLANQVLDFKDELFKNVGGSNFISKGVNRLVWCVGYCFLIWRLCVPIIDAYGPVKDEFTYWLKQKLNQKYVIELGHQTNVANAQELQSELTEGIGEVEEREEGRELSVEETIEKVAKEEGADHKVLLALAQCESNFRADAYNPTNGSMDRGIFQISKKWHNEVSDDEAYNPETATRQAIRIMNERGIEEWAGTTLSCMANKHGINF